MTQKIVNWVYPTEDCVPGNNYINLKAHKPHKNYPGRLISASCNGYTNNLASLTVHELRKVNLPYNLKDTNNFLQKIDNVNRSGIFSSINDNIYMVSFDIEAMFPSITKEHGLQACKQHLDMHKNPIFSTECIIDAIEITLDHNITSFNGKYFRQIKGTAMGAKNACDYADISMKELDRYIHEEDIESKHGIRKPIMFERFRDDIFAIFPDDDSIKKCYALLNSFYDNISFTMSTISTEGIEFLDTFISYDIDKHTLHTKPFSKPCDSHCYLTPLSCHPTHILRNIPYNIAHRIYKISSNQDIYLESKNEYSKYLLDRGYSEEIITASFEKVEKLSRNDLIQPSRRHNSTTCVNFVITTPHFHLSENILISISMSWKWTPLWFKLLILKACLLHIDPILLSRTYWYTVNSIHPALIAIHQWEASVAITVNYVMIF